MAKKYLFNILAAAVFLVLSSCSKFEDNSLFNNVLPPVKEPVPPVINQTLKEKTGWVIDSMATGLIRYTYSGLYQSHSANQNVNVVELDLNNPEYQLEIKFVSSADSLSKVAENYDAIIGINGTYESDASFIKSNGTVHSQVTIPQGHLRYWKHEGAFSFTTQSNPGIAFGTNSAYQASPALNILSGAPMLISDGNPVGENFIGDVTGVNLNSLDYEDYRRHQGVRHPRTAIALTEDNKLLLITIDGRFSQAAGMTAKETTQFLKRYFQPKNALNLDGGGSTTMYIKDSKVSSTGIVNYPADNGIYNHYGQRLLRSFILIRKVGTGSAFAGGDGTENNPYLIRTPTHLQNMHNVNWSGAKDNPLHFKLDADIDMAGKNWQPINNASPYERHLHFDGNGHIIKNLTSKGVAYAGLFGVLIGSCKNLGVVDAVIESTNGAGILGGYVGLKGPNQPTGIVENCFTSGTVSGTDAVGGIAGNIGKPNGQERSVVRNSYSTANVTATVASGNSRAGGVAGIVWENGVLENCYAAGTITSNNSGAGGLIGWTDASVKGLVALNPAVINKKTGRLGRISATMGSVAGNIAQGTDCWGLSTMTVDNAGTILTESSLKTGPVTVANSSFDGTSRTAAFLIDFANYSTILKWPAGPGQPWAQVMKNGKPQLQWQFLRGD